MNFFREMSLRWHVIWVVGYCLAYVMVLGSGYLQHHVVFIGQQTLALTAGGAIAGLTMRLQYVAKR